MVRGCTERGMQRGSTRTPPIQFNDWFSFSELDHFNSDILVSHLTAKNTDGLPFRWTSLKKGNECEKVEIPINALKQAESLFNLSQLMFALYHGSLNACTFLDLQWNNPPRDIRQHGFKKLENMPIKSGASFRSALHSLCWDIVENGGLVVIFSMIQNPVIPIIQQKCLDALTNILCVDQIERLVLLRQPWFLRKLLKMVQSGDLQCDMVPAISVLDRLVVVVLADKSMQSLYDQVCEEHLVEIIVNRLQETGLNTAKNHQHYLKFQTIAMQAVALMCQDNRSKDWHSSTRDLLFNHAYRSFLIWDTEHPPSDPLWHRSENFYRNMSFSSSTLLFSLMVLIHSVLKWSGKKEYLISQGLNLKYQLSRMRSALCTEESKLDVNVESVRCAVNWLWNVLYVESRNNQDSQDLEKLLNNTIRDPLSELREKVLRKCSNTECSNNEIKPNTFALCNHCEVTSYCSNGCRDRHMQEGHSEKICQFLSMWPDEKY